MRQIIPKTFECKTCGNQQYTKKRCAKCEGFEFEPILFMGEHLIGETLIYDGKITVYKGMIVEVSDLDQKKEDTLVVFDQKTKEQYFFAHISELKNLSKDSPQGKKVLGNYSHIIAATSEQRWGLGTTDGGDIDRKKITKWLEQEAEGCRIRGETDREAAMRQLLLKIERGYFDKTS